MTNASTRMHDLNRAADEALRAATDALGTLRFPVILAKCHQAMRHASKGRMTVRRAYRPGQQGFARDLCGRDRRGAWLLRVRVTLRRS
jgi:hypothetical protein